MVSQQINAAARHDQQRRGRQAVRSNQYRPMTEDEKLQLALDISRTYQQDRIVQRQ